LHFLAADYALQSREKSHAAAAAAAVYFEQLGSNLNKERGLLHIVCSNFVFFADYFLTASPYYYHRALP